MKTSIVFLVVTLASLHASEIDDLGELSLTSLLDIPVESSSSFNESLLTAPSSVAVLKTEDWEKLGAKRPIDAISHLTGVVTYPDNVSSGATLRIRGYSDILPRGIAFMIDGVPLNDYVFGTADLSFHQLGLAGISKIEVVKGPGSTKYGTDAFHGSLSLKTKEGYRDESNIEVDIGTNNYLSASSTSTLVQEKYIVDFSIQGTKQGNQKRDFSYEDSASSNMIHDTREMKSQYYNSIFKVRSNLDSAFSYELGVYLIGSDSKDFQGLGRLTGPPSNRNLEMYDRLNQDSNMQIAQGKVNYSGFKNIDISVSSFIWQNDRTVQRYFLTGDATTLLQDQQLVQQRKGVKLTTSSKEAIYNTMWSINFGYDEIDIKKAHTKLFTTNATLARRFDEPYNGMRRKVKNIAVEFKTVYDKFHFNYGLRMDEYSSFGKQYSPRLGLSYLYSDTGVIKALYSQAFRAGSAGEQVSTTQTQGDLNIKPETIDSYELVWMQAVNDLELEVSFFKTYWHHAIIRSIEVTPAKFVNRDENSAEGVEIKTKYLFNKDLYSRLGLSFIRSTSKTTGVDYVAYPERVVDFGIGYIYNSKTSLYWSNRIMDEMLATTSGTSKDLPLYWQSDLHVDYQASRKLKYSLQIYNMFNRDNYMSSLQGDPNGALSEEFSAVLSALYTF